jgi:GNAT superfamily N-acetyltransferase
VWQEPYSAIVGRVADYGRVKTLLNRGRHPTFIGREMISRAAHNGGVLLFVLDDKDVAASVMNVRTNALTVLCVDPSLRGRGFGSEVLRFLKPNWVRALESAVPWFEARGYRAVGDWKQGRSLRTRVLVRETLLSLSGRLRARLGPCAGQSPTGTADRTQGSR